MARLIERLTPQVTRLIINANGDPARFARSGCRSSPTACRIIPGRWPACWPGWTGRPHPRPTIEWIVTVPGDAPFLPRDLVARLHAARATAGVRSPAPRRAAGRIRWSRCGRVAMREALRRARGGAGHPQDRRLHRAASGPCGGVADRRRWTRSSTSIRRRIWPRRIALRSCTRSCDYESCELTLLVLGSTEPEVLSMAADEGVRARSGKGYNARVEKVLREALAKGQLSGLTCQLSPQPGRMPDFGEAFPWRRGRRCRRGRPNRENEPHTRCSTCRCRFRRQRS